VVGRPAPARGPHEHERSEREAGDTDEHEDDTKDR
jgi:hypothetical protein